MKYLYYLYQLCIALPLGLLITIGCCLLVIIGCSLGYGHFWGYWPAPIWSKASRMSLWPTTKGPSTSSWSMAI